MTGTPTTPATAIRRPGVVITGAGVLSPLGTDRRLLHRALVAGESGLRPITVFDAGALPFPLAGELDGHGPEPILGEERNLRPLDRTGRLAAAAAGLALADGGLAAEGAGEAGRPGTARTERNPDPKGARSAFEHRPQRSPAGPLDPDDPSGPEPPPEPPGLVLGTMFGSLRTISEFDRRALTAGPNYTKPFDFANSVINAAAGQAAIWHGLTAVNATVAGGATAGVQALAYAADLIRAGRARALLAGGAEELCFESSWGFAQAGLTVSDPGRVPVPFHARRGGFAPGEGAALLVLEEEGAARRRGARVLGRLAGSGNAFDPSLGRDPERATAAVTRAVRLALEDAGRAPEEVDCLSVSASGLPELDRREARGLAAVFGGRAAELPVTAVKGALGESLGAGGAFQTLVALESLAAGELPGIAGLDQPEAGLPLALAGEESRRGGFRRALVTTVAWDGNACALVVER